MENFSSLLFDSNLWNNSGRFARGEVLLSIKGSSLGKPFIFGI